MEGVHVIEIKMYYRYVKQNIQSDIQCFKYILDPTKEHDVNLTTTPIMLSNEVLFDGFKFIPFIKTLP